jgi:hypothetical protein
MAYAGGNTAGEPKLEKEEKTATHKAGAKTQAPPPGAPNMDMSKHPVKTPTTPGTPRKHSGGVIKQ